MIGDFQALIFKLYTDKKIRESFTHSPEKIFQTYNLTAKEKIALAGIPGDRLEMFTESLLKKKLRSGKKTAIINFKTLISAGSLRFLWVVLKDNLFGKKITCL